MTKNEINIAFAELLGWTNCSDRNGIPVGIIPPAKRKKKQIDWENQYEIIEDYYDSLDRIVELQNSLIVTETDRLNFTSNAVSFAIKDKFAEKNGNYYYKILTLSKQERCELILLTLGKHKDSPKD